MSPGDMVRLIDSPTWVGRVVRVRRTGSGKMTVLVRWECGRAAEFVGAEIAHYLIALPATA